MKMVLDLILNQTMLKFCYEKNKNKIFRNPKNQSQDHIEGSKKNLMFF